MSEKTLGEVVRDAWFESPARGAVAWQAAADAIAAPLLARIAELEEEAGIWKRDYHGVYASLVAERERNAVAYQRGVAEERERCAAEIKRLTQEIEAAIYRLEEIDARDGGPGWTKAKDLLGCDLFWILTELQKAICSAPPAVGVTSDKGGER